MCDKGDVDFLKFLYPDGNDGYTDQFGEPPYAMNADAGDDYIICAPYISGSGTCPGEGSAKCERKTVRVASYQNTPDGGSSCDEVVFYLEPMACTKGGGSGGSGGGGDSSDSKDGSDSKSGGKKGDDFSDDSSDDSKDGSGSKSGVKNGDDSSDDSKDGSDSKSGYKNGGSKEHDSAKSGGKGDIFKGWGGKEGDSKDGGGKIDLRGKFGGKIDIPGKFGDHKSNTGGAKDDGSKSTTPCAKGKSG